MKKSILALVIMIIVTITSLSVVHAATGDVTLKLSNDRVKPGDTFTVTLHAECADGINGVLAEFSYDTEKLDLVSGLGVSKDDESENWVNLKGSKTKVEINDQRDEPEPGQSKPHIKTADVYVLTFKVKDDVQIGGTAFVKAENIEVDSDIKDETFTVEPRNVTITIDNETSKPSNENENQNQNQNQNQNGGSSEKNDNDGNTHNNPNNSTNAGKSNIQTVNSTSGKTDPTTATKILPKTGFITIASVALIALVVLSIVMFKKLIKYDGIK